MSTVQTLILTKAQAQSLVTEIKAGIIEVGDKLKELHDGEGWKALGYDNWKECYSKEFNFSKSRVYQLLTHVNVRENIAMESTMVDLPAHERQSRELADLDPPNQTKSWIQAQDEAGTKQPTAKQVRQAADNFRPVPKPEPKKTVKSPTSSGWSSSDAQSSADNRGGYNLTIHCLPRDWTRIQSTFDDPSWTGRILASLAGLSNYEIEDFCGFGRDE